MPSLGPGAAAGEALGTNRSPRIYGQVGCQASLEIQALKHVLITPSLIQATFLVA